MFDFIIQWSPWAAGGLLVLGFLPLIKGADFLVNGASALASRLKIPPLVIGLTIVAFGTSTPELVVNLFSAAQGSTALALGNVIGSNIFNILGILGITALIYPLAVQKTTTWIEIPLVLLAALMVTILASDLVLDGQNLGGLSGVLGRIDGLVLLGFFLIFLVYNFSLSQAGGPGEEMEIRSYSVPASLGLIALGLGLLVLGGKMIVDGGVAVAGSLGLSERVIGLTIVSIGTSLPELATSVVAALKKNTAIAVGNIVGSNIFNIFFILGATALVKPIPVTSGSTVDLMVNILTSILLFVVIFTGRGRKISRVEGGLMLGLYIAYLVWLLLN